METAELGLTTVRDRVPSPFSGSGFFLFPEAFDPFEGLHGFFQEVMIFLVEAAGLTGEPAGGIGNLIARSEHLSVEAFELGAVGLVAENAELSPGVGDLVFADLDRRLPLRPFVDVDPLRVRRVLEGIHGLGNRLRLRHGVGSRR
jgi:hypothetical protein